MEETKDYNLTKTIDEVLIEFINDCLKPSKNFVLSQAPDIIKELILFKFFRR